MKIFVTGASGYIGGHLCSRLISEGHIVYGLSRKNANFAASAFYQINGRLSVSDSNQWIEKLPLDLDAVIHLAGLTVSFNPEKFYESNAKTTEILINDLKKKYERLKFIFISSTAAAGPSLKNTPNSENDVPAPVSHYGKSKLLAEQLLSQNASEKWTRIILRPPPVIGPGDKAFDDIFRLADRFGIFLVPGPNWRQVKSSFVSIHDLTGVICKCLKYDSPDVSIFFAAHPDPFTMSDFINAVKSASGKRKLFIIPWPLVLGKLFARLSRIFARAAGFKSSVAPDKVDEVKCLYWVCSSEKSQKLLNFIYKWDFHDSIEDAFRAYKESINGGKNTRLPGSM